MAITRRKRSAKTDAPKPAPVVSTHPLDGVHPGIRRTVEADVAGKWDQVEVFVVSPTRVEWRYRS